RIASRYMSNLQPVGARNARARSSRINPSKNETPAPAEMSGRDLARSSPRPAHPASENSATRAPGKELATSSRPRQKSGPAIAPPAYPRSVAGPPRNQSDCTGTLPPDAPAPSSAPATSCPGSGTVTHRGAPGAELLAVVTTEKERVGGVSKAEWARIGIRRRESSVPSEPVLGVRRLARHPGFEVEPPIPRADAGEGVDAQPAEIE